MRLKLISCSVFIREMESAIKSSPHEIDPEYLPMGLHNLEAQNLVGEIQRIVDSSSQGVYEAVLIGYGFCNKSIFNLKARSIPIIIPRAHDCINIFFGSSARYISYSHAHPRTFFKTGGWITHGSSFGDLNIIDTYAFIDTGLQDNDALEEMVRKEAMDEDYNFESITGDLSIIKHLVNGEWREEEFLFLKPGEMVKPTFDERIISGKT